MADERRTVSKAEESQPEAPRPHVVGQGPNYTSGELIDLSLRVLGISNKAEESYQASSIIPKAPKPHVGQGYMMVSALILFLRMLGIF